MKNLTLAAFLLLVCTLTSAQTLELLESSDELPTLRWQRMIGENLLREKITSAIAPLARDQRFGVFVAIRLKSLKGQQRVRPDFAEFDSSDNTVDLGKLGTAAPAISDEVISKGTLWSQVEFIRTEVILYDHAPKEQLQLMEIVTKKIVHSTVPNWRSRIEIISPKFEWSSWLFDRKILFGAFASALFFCLLGIFILVNYFFLRHLDEKERVSFVQVTPPKMNHEALVPELGAPVRYALPAPVFELGSTNSSEIDPRHLEPHEWQSLIEKDLHLGAVIANVFPVEVSARMLSQLPVELMKKMAQIALQMSEQDIEAKTADLKKILGKLAKRRSGQSFLDNAVELIGRVGPQREDIIFHSLIEAARLDLFALAARQNFPSELVVELPSPLLSRFVALLRADERIELVASVDPKYRDLFLDASGEPGNKVRDYVQMQIEKLELEGSHLNEIRQKANFIWWDFLKVIRRSIRTDETLAHEVEPVLNRWMQDRIKRSKVRGRNENAA